MSARPAHRRATVLAILAAVLVLAVGGTVWAQVRAFQLRVPGDNAALADAAATREVSEQVGAALKAVLSYDYNNLERTERAAADVLVGTAAREYGARFAEAAERARRDRLIRTTTVRSIGVSDLRGDTARLLVHVDQQTLPTAERGTRESSSAYLDVTARKTAGAWKIAELTTL